MPRQPGVYAVFDTSEGNIVCRLFEQEAPITVKNFIELAEGSREWTDPRTRSKSKSPLYHGTIFHRVIPDFMIQGGDPAGTGMGGPGYQFQDETKGSPHKFDKTGKLAMANSAPARELGQTRARLPRHRPGTASSGRLRFNKCHRTARLRLAIPIALNMQNLCGRPLYSVCDSRSISICWGIHKRSVIDVRQTAACRKTAKLIEPCLRRRFELHATSRNILHERR